MGNQASKSDESGSVNEEAPSANANKDPLDRNSHNKVLLDTKKTEGMMTRSPSGANIGSEKGYAQLIPVEKLAEILRQKTNAKFGVNGIVEEIFVTQVFPNYGDLGHRLFKYLHTNSRAKTEHLGTMAFRQQTERLLGILDDTVILESYIKMFANEERPDFICKEDVQRLLRTCFQIAMGHYGGDHKTCPLLDRTISTVVRSIFLVQECLSIGFVCRWFNENGIRLVLLVHRYCVHTLSTAYRGLDVSEKTIGVDLSTPVLEQQNPFPKNPEDRLMPLSEAWLLAGTLPSLYTKPQVLPPPASAATNSTPAVTQIFKQKLSMIPSHWTLLYDTNDHGVGANRFLHHVLGYRGPTLVLLHTIDDQTYCIASPTEWKETNLYTGGEDSCVVQLLPKFSILEKGAKILYLNTSIRGYPKGLRAGSDPRRPLLAVDESFENIDCKGLAAGLKQIEVWGCGDKTSREVQLDIKKWQKREAERQRTVKLTAADWMDHPDRYLLELGGRTNYNN